MTPDYDAIIAGGRPPEDTVPVCTRGDLVGKYNALAQQALAARAQSANDPRMAGNGTTEIAAKLEALKAEIEAATVPFHLRGLSREAWETLCDEHPPHVDEAGERIAEDRIGVHGKTFFPALIRSSTISPPLREETWEKLLDPSSGLLTSAQFVKLRKACWELNKEDVDIPFSLAASLMTRLFEDNSDSPDPSESAGDD